MSLEEELAKHRANKAEPTLWDLVADDVKPLYERPTKIDTARVVGIAVVESHTPEEWGQAFDEAVAEIGFGSTFSVYDLLEKVGKPEGVHPSAIGARMRRASLRGIVVKVGHAERASHGDVVTLWQRVGQES